MISFSVTPPYSLCITGYFYTPVGKYLRPYGSHISVLDMHSRSLSRVDFWFSTGLQLGQHPHTPDNTVQLYVQLSPPSGPTHFHLRGVFFSVSELLTKAPHTCACVVMSHMA